MSAVFNNIKTTYPPVQQTPVANQATKPTEELTVKQAMAAKNVGDTYESSGKPAKGKGINGVIANIKSFFAAFGEYTKGTIGGIIKGVAAGSLLYTAGNIINHFREKAGKKLLHNKPLAILVGACTLGINLWKASLNVNEKRSDIHHRWIGH